MQWNVVDVMRWRVLTLIYLFLITTLLKHTCLFWSFFLIFPCLFFAILVFNKEWKYCMCVASFYRWNWSVFSLMTMWGVTVSFLPYPHCDTVTLSQPSSCTVAFAATSLSGTPPLNDLQWNRTDWLSSPHQATSVKTMFKKDLSECS